MCCSVSNIQPVQSFWSHLVGLRRLVEHAGIDGRRHQVVGCCDGVDVTRQMQVELKKKKKEKNKALELKAGLEKLCPFQLHNWLDNQSSIVDSDP